MNLAQIEAVVKIATGWKVLKNGLILVPGIQPGQTVSTYAWKPRLPDYDSESMWLAAQIVHRLMDGAWEMPERPEIMSPMVRDNAENLVYLADSIRARKGSFLILGSSLPMIQEELPAQLGKRYKDHCTLPKVGLQQREYGLQFSISWMGNALELSSCRFLTLDEKK